jgi:hypothetical protein
MDTPFEAQWYVLCPVNRPSRTDIPYLSHFCSVMYRKTWHQRHLQNVTIPNPTANDDEFTMPEGGILEVDSILSNDFGSNELFVCSNSGV